MFNVSVNDKKNIYRSKPVMNVDTVPKPLTYDYMPEGYPSKGIEYVTLMEEQEVTFFDIDSGLMEALSPVALDIKLGDKLTVVWDGVNYDAVVKGRVISGPGGNLVEKMFGNLALINRGESEDYPFVCNGVSDPVNESYWTTADTAASHTIKVMRQQETITPMSTDFIPKNLNVVFKKESGNAQVNCNVTYNELRDWVERDVPVFAVFINDADYSQCNIFNITGIALLTDMLGFVYYISAGASKSFAYKSDGTIETRMT